MSKLNPRRPVCDLSSFDAAVEKAAAAREEHFPSWRRIATAASLVTGLVMLVVSMVVPRQVGLAGADALALADICYMVGFVVLVLELLHLAWIAVHMPPAPAREVHERTVECAPDDLKANL